MVDKERYVTSEEKLLKLIRRKDQAQKQKGAQAVSLPMKGMSFGTGALTEDWLTSLNKILMAVVAGLAIFLIIKAVFLSNGQAALPVVKEQTVAVTAAGQGAKDTQQKPLDYYVSAVEKRDMFDTSFAPAAASAPDKKAATTASDDPRNDLRLVGIVMDSKPQAIIEDTKANTTYFLSQGQQVNQFTISDIKEDKVTLSSNGKTYELSNE